MQSPWSLAGGLLLGVFAVAQAHAAEPQARPQLNFEVLPYAGERVGDTSDTAQPGAMLRFDLSKPPPAKRDGEDKLTARLQELGVRDGGEFGDQGRWYMFVAGSGKAVGLNMRRDADGLLRNHGFSVDPAASVGEVQAGVGWRRGQYQTSLGYVRREFKPLNPMKNIGFDDDDDMVALTFSIKPGR